MAPNRPHYPMASFIRETLNERDLMKSYKESTSTLSIERLHRLAYRAKLEATRQKRLNQMLDELESGGVYMKMLWKKSHPLFNGRCDLN